MKTIKQFKILLILLLMTMVMSVTVNADTECRIGKNYIISVSGNGYSMSGKILLDEFSLPSTRQIIPNVTSHGNFIGTLAYTKALSKSGSSSVEAEARLSFDSYCTMHGSISLGGTPVSFTAYSDDTASANGVVVGDVLISDQYAGLVGAIRISAK